MTTRTDTALKRYLRRFQKLPMLDADEEYQHAQDWYQKKDSKARETLIASHQRLIQKIARGYRGYGLPESDLMSEGIIGLIHALDRFDPEKGFRFSTYAMWWIKAQIKKYVLKNGSMVAFKNSGHEKKLFFRLKKAMKELADKKPLDDRHVTEQELADHLQVPLEHVKDMKKRLLGGDVSLQQTVGGDDKDGKDWQSWVRAPQDVHEETALRLDTQKNIRLLNEAVKILSERERAILKARRLKEPPSTLQDCAETFDLSKERIRQIENKAFQKLQEQVRSLHQDL